MNISIRLMEVNFPLQFSNSFCLRLYNQVVSVGVRVLPCTPTHLTDTVFCTEVHIFPLSKAQPFFFSPPFISYTHTHTLALPRCAFLKYGDNLFVS